MMFDEWISELRQRWNALFRRRQLDRDLEEEMAFHQAMREDQLRETERRLEAVCPEEVDARIELVSELAPTATGKFYLYVSLERFRKSGGAL